MALTRIDDRGLKTPVDLLDNEKIRFGTGNDLEIYHGGSDSFIKDGGTGSLKIGSSAIWLQAADYSESMASFTPNGAVELYYDNAKKFETFSWGVQNYGNVACRDNDKHIIGNNSDLQIFHDGSNSKILNTTGYLLVSTSSGILYLDGNSTYIRSGDGGEVQAKFIDDGAVELYHNNVKKLETTSTGVTISGTCGASTFSGFDNAKLQLGTSQDLQIYHDGSASYISDVGTHGIFIQSDGPGVYIRGKTGEDSIKALSDGAVELYHDNSLKLHTSSDGVTAVGYINNQHLRGGSGDMYVGNAAQGDLYIYVQDNTNNSIILQANTGEKYLEAKMGGAVDLYHHGSKKLETTSSGVEVTGRINLSDNLDMPDSAKVILGDGDDLKLYHNGSNSVIQHAGGGHLYVQTTGTDEDLFLKANRDIYIQPHAGETGAKFAKNGASELYYDNGKRFETTTGGAKITGNGMVTGDFLVDSDSGRLKCGLDEDLQLYHDGHSKIIHNGAGHFYIKTEGADEDLVINAERDAYIQCSAGENGVICKDDAEVQLYYNNVKKFETRGFGARVYGHLGVGVDPGNTPNGRNNFIAIGDNDTGIAQNTDGQLELWSNNQEIVNIDTGSMTCYKDFRPHATNNNDLGSSALRWRNLYVNDAHFSNEGGSNSVDGTWGDWTLQEGEEDIFMLNNRTGKKYKMALTEVN